MTLPLFVTRGLRAGEGTFTMLYSVLSCGSVVSALFVARRNLVSMRDIVRGVAFFGVALLLLAGVAWRQDRDHPWCSWSAAPACST